jgi:hypothetical protein
MRKWIRAGSTLAMDVVATVVLCAVGWEAPAPLDLGLRAPGELVRGPPPPSGGAASPPGNPSEDVTA